MTIVDEVSSDKTKIPDEFIFRSVLLDCFTAELDDTHIKGGFGAGVIGHPPARKLADGYSNSCPKTPPFICV